MSDDDDTHVEATKVKSSVMVRIKKHLSTKTADSSLGRSLIIQSLGPHGEELFFTLFDSIRVHFGEKISLELQADLLKISLKTKILFDEKILTPETFSPLDKPVRDYFFQVLRDLSIKEELKDQSIFVSPDEIIRTIEPVRKAVVEIFSSRIKPRNVDKIKSLFDHFYSKEYLAKLLNDKAFSEARQALKMASLFSGFSSEFVGNRAFGNCS
jgi:hypothetical protein